MAHATGPCRASATRLTPGTSESRAYRSDGVTPKSDVAESRVDEPEGPAPVYPCAMGAFHDWVTWHRVGRGPASTRSDSAFTVCSRSFTPVS